MPKGGRTGLDRGAFSAGYNHIPFIVPTLGAATMLLRWKAPYACRVMEVSAGADAHTGGSYTIANETDTVDLVANRVLPTVDTVETLTPTSTTVLVAAARDFDKGDIMLVSVIASTSASGVYIGVTVKVEGHVVASEAND